MPVLELLECAAAARAARERMAQRFDRSASPQSCRILKAGRGGDVVHPPSPVLRPKVVNPRLPNLLVSRSQDSCHDARGLNALNHL
jgi:hypothetical protein